MTKNKFWEDRKVKHKIEYIVKHFKILFHSFRCWNNCYWKYEYLKSKFLDSKSYIFYYCRLPSHSNYIKFWLSIGWNIVIKRTQRYKRISSDENDYFSFQCTIIHWTSSSYHRKKQVYGIMEIPFLHAHYFIRQQIYIYIFN